MSNGLNISLKSYDSIFQNDEQRNTEEIKPVPISELKPFTEQPFKVKLDEDMDALVDSIKQCGVLTPVIARPHKDGGYEILSGHRRVKACELAGITDIPVVVKNLDDDTATILLVDSNLQREHILPSEKAFAYQMKLEAMKRKAGRPTKENCEQIAHNFDGKKSSEILGEQVGESKDQIRRYIRLSSYAISIMYIGMSLGSVVLGPLADRIEPKKVLAASLTLTGVGCAIMLLFTAQTSVIILAASLGILGFGLGGNAAIFMKVVLSGVPAETAGAGTGTYGLFRDLAAPFGVAIFVPLFTNRVTNIISSGKGEITAAVNSIKFLAVAEIICVIAGIAIVLFLPKIYIKKGEKA